MPDPSGPPSPSASQKESSGWWAAAKNRLTPTKEKEYLTPAQQIIQETKTREKEIKKNGKGREKEWQGMADDKYTNPAFLNTPLRAQRKPAPTSPASPTPFRPNVRTDLSPSPMHSVEARQGDTSSSREAPPLYAQFNGQGTLDMPGTLLVIARRFEKLEKWTVGHVRALEERMSDVERWLVDKEKEKEKQSLSTLDLSEGKDDKAQPTQELHEIRNEITELQGRVGELGREMAKLATAPSNLSTGPSRSPAIVPPPLSPQVSSSADIMSLTAQPALPSTPGMTTTPRHIPNSTARASTSPPLASSGPSGARNYSRLPYPSGDYATPPDSTLPDRGAFASPTHSPPSSLSSTRPLNIPGLPNTTTNPSSSASSYGSVSSGLTGTISSASQSSDLPLPKRPADRPASVSPTPRKRYTVALGGPIMDRSDRDKARPQNSTFSSPTVSADDEEEEGSEDGYNNETIGKSSARLISSNSPPTESSAPSETKNRVFSNRRSRTQSAYISPSPPNALASPSLSPPSSSNRLRSQSIGLGISNGQPNSQNEAGGVFSGGKFVDPLVLRKQEKEGFSGKSKIATGGGVKKVPVGQLVAFFDGDRKD